ncbi:hypothetical protein AX16_007364 [Volvariella volvacea WC 439]|nr:hypothetical protein AX16_007364 [Volvariella volvacea WC 439]
MPPYILTAYSSLHNKNLPCFARVILLVSTVVRNFFQALVHCFFPPLADGHGNPIPDGPIGLPIIGLWPFLFPCPQETIRFWAKKFGNLYSFYLGNQLFLIVSDSQIFRDLTEKEEEVGLSESHRELWRFYRRSGFLRSTSTLSSQSEIESYTLDSLLRAAFSIEAKHFDNPVVQNLGQVLRDLSGCKNSSCGLKGFAQGLLSWKAYRARKAHQEAVQAFVGVVQAFRIAIDAGRPVPDCFARRLLASEVGNATRGDCEVAQACFSLIHGDFEKITSLAATSLEILSSNPELLTRVSTSPALGDVRTSAVMNAIIKAAQKSHQSAQLNCPERSYTTSYDLTYRGKFIPKGTVVIYNNVSEYPFNGRRRYRSPTPNLITGPESSESGIGLEWRSEISFILSKLLA